MTEKPVTLLEAAETALDALRQEDPIHSISENKECVYCITAEKLYAALAREKSLVARREAVIEAARKKPRPDVRVEYPLFCSSKEPRIIVTYDASIEEALKAYDDALVKEGR